MKVYWLTDRGEQRRAKRGRTGDTREKLAEEARRTRAGTADVSVEGTVKHASTAIIANSAPING